MRKTLLWVGLLLSVCLVGSACEKAWASVEGVGISTIVQGTDSVRFVLSWGAVLDRRGNPVVGYQWELWNSIADSLLDSGSTTAALVDTTKAFGILPGDSIGVYAKARAVDDRGTAGQWGQSEDYTYTLPDLLGPVAPTVSVDTMAYDIVGIVVEPQFAAISPDGTVQYCAFGILSTGEIVKMRNSWNIPVCADYHQVLLGLQRDGLRIRVVEA